MENTPNPPMPQSQNETFSACPNCGSAKISDLSGFEAKCLMRCSDCRFVFDKRIPTLAQLEAHYSSYAYSARKPCPPATIDSFNRLLDQFEVYRKNGRILDVGCGQGDFLLEARKRGWEVYGTEYSPAAVMLCRDEGLEIAEGALGEQTFGDKQFDIITSFEVFEHINNGPEEIALIAGKMRPGGLFYLTTPNFNALLRHFEKSEFKMIAWPEHISYYSPAAMRALARAAGLQVERIATTGIAPGRVKVAVKNLLGRAQTKNEPGAPAHPNQAWRQDSTVLRDRMRTSPALRLAKNVVDRTLTIFGAGDTLKVWMRK